MKKELYTIKQIYPASSLWPSLLNQIPLKDIPASLYYKGNFPDKDSLIIGIVGTRHPTSYGISAAREISSYLAANGIIIASGMAIGIDTESHKACIENGGKTIAVLGSGLNEDVIYPQINKSLASSITDTGGCLISEYEPTEKANKWSFPARNRIIAGISKAIVVIESREKGGALITARLSNEYGRDVFSLPGEIFNSASRGTNMLIQSGAIPITCPEDITNALNIETSGILKNKLQNLSDEENQITSCLENPLTVDEIIKICKLPRHVILPAVSKLEIKGIITITHDNKYRIIN